MGNRDKMRTPKRRDKDTGMLKIELTIKLLEAAPITIDELIEGVGASRATIRRYLTTISARYPGRLVKEYGGAEFELTTDEVII